MNIDLYLANQWSSARNGNLEAYGDIHKHLFPKLYNYLQKIVDDEDLSQDLIQDLFLKLWEGREKIGPIYNVRQYFFRSAKSLACNHLKRMKRLSLLTETQEANLVFSREDILVQEENQKVMTSQILYAINGLSERRKEIIYLKYYQNLSYSEISTITGITYQSVANHIYRAILQMRELLATKRTNSVTENAIPSYLHVNHYKYFQHAGEC